MAVSGDDDRLRRLIAAFRSLASSGAQSELMADLAVEAGNQVEAGFREGRDPYGNPWKDPIRTGRTLEDTADLKNSFSFRADARGFRIGTNKVYARIHQYGGIIKAKHVRMSTYRQFLPGGGSSTVRRMRFVARPMLRFQIEVGRRAFTKSGRPISEKKRGTRGNALMAWVMVPQVRIPKRQMVPEGKLGPIWLAALEKRADSFLCELFDQK